MGDEPPGTYLYYSSCHQTSPPPPLDSRGRLSGPLTPIPLIPLIGGYARRVDGCIDGGEDGWIDGGVLGCEQLGCWRGCTLGGERG